MYACIHLPESLVEAAAQRSLLDLAREFSPELEQAAVNTIVFSIAPLRLVLGPCHQIASEICRRGYEQKLNAHLAIAANPDTAVLLARHFPGVTLAAPGEEALKLANIPLASLCEHDVPVDATLLDTFHQWGVKTCEDLAALPENGIAERLGMAGIYLRNLALGNLHRPLRLAAQQTNYEERMDLDYPLDRLEPLLFLFGRVLSDLCGRLRSQAQAARILEARLYLDRKEEYRCKLEFPVPLAESHTMLKLLQLHLERHSPGALVLGFMLRIEPVEPRCLQGGLFLPPTPQPDKLQLTLARIAGLVGEGNVGTPQLVDTFRPDAFRLTAIGDPLWPQEPEDSRQILRLSISGLSILRLSMRIFRPAIEAQVHVVNSVPRRILAAGVKGRVLESAGPWKTSGEWWSSCAWTREEWDVELDDGALYRIYHDLPACVWYVHGVYD